MKRLVLKKWVEVMLSVIALTGMVMFWVYGNQNVILSLIGAVIGFVAESIVIIYGRN